MNTRTFVALFGALALVGCKSDGENPTETDPGTTTGCEITIDNSIPSAGETDVYYRSTIQLEFSTADSSAEVSIDGVTGSGEWIDDTYFWTPDAPLDPDTSYTANVTWCDGDGSAAIDFTTSDVGASVPDGDVQDSAYNLDIGSGNFVQPPGVGALLSSQLEVDILIGVVEAAGANLTLQGALGAEGASPPAQDLCTESIDFPSADFSANPYFEVGPQTTTLEVQDLAITIDDLFVSGAFAPDGSSIEGAVLAGSIDTRPLVPLIDPDPAAPETAVCDLVTTFGISCEACTTGGNFCLSLLVDSMVATEVSGLTVVARSTDEIAADPNCSPE